MVKMTFTVTQALNGWVVGCGGYWMVCKLAEDVPETIMELAKVVEKALEEDGAGAEFGNN